MKIQRSETLPLQILAILISIVIWSWIQLNEEESDVKRVTINYLTPTELIQSEELPKSISVELIGAKGRIRQIKNRQLNMTLDLRDVHLGQNQQPLQESALTNLPDGISVARFSPPILELEFDNPSIREIPIRPNIIGTPNKKFKVSSIQTNPKSIPVKGPERYLSELEYISTKVVNIGNLDQNKTFSSQISLQSSILSIKQANQIDVTVELKERNTVSVLENLQVVSNHFDWEVQPNVISILVESEEDVSMHEQLLLNVDSLLEDLNNEDLSNEELIHSQSITLNFADHPDLFTLPTEAPYTIKNLDPSTLTIQYVDPTRR